MDGALSSRSFLFSTQGADYFLTSHSSVASSCASSTPSTARDSSSAPPSATVRSSHLSLHPPLLILLFQRRRSPSRLLLSLSSRARLRRLPQRRLVCSLLPFVTAAAAEFRAAIEPGGKEVVVVVTCSTAWAIGTGIAVVRRGWRS